MRLQALHSASHNVLGTRSPRVARPVVSYNFRQFWFGSDSLYRSIKTHRVAGTRAVCSLTTHMHSLFFILLRFKTQPAFSLCGGCRSLPIPVLIVIYLAGTSGLNPFFISPFSMQISWSSRRLRHRATKGKKTPYWRARAARRRERSLGRIGTIQGSTDMSTIRYTRWNV